MNQIHWSPAARDTYAAILRYVMDNFPLDTALKMDEKVEKLLSLLAQNKKLCPPSVINAGIRRCVITKHLSVAYREEGDRIELIAFYDNRAAHLF